MATSWRPGCPVPLEDLRYLTVSYVGFDGQVSDGELVVAVDVAEPVVAVFARLFELRYPIASLRLVDDFAGSDDASMAANNSVRLQLPTGHRNDADVQRALLRHGDRPQSGAEPLRRGRHRSSPGGPRLPRPSAEPGVLHAGDPVVLAFASIGWSWGGDWDGPVDYQHFSLSGR